MLFIEWWVQGQFFVTLAFQLCFRICHMKDARKSEQNEQHGIQRFVVYIDHVNSGDDNTSTYYKS